MRTSKINYFIVGMFVIVMIVGLVVSVALLTGRTGATDGYHAYYSNVTGVKFGTQVVYEGYPIGQVIEVTPEEQNGRMRFRVDFDVIEGWRIPDDSIVAIAAPGLLAAVTLAVEAGQSTAALEPGAEVPAQERSDMFAAVADVAGDFGDLSNNYLKPLLRNVDSTVTQISEFLAVGGEGRLIAADARDTMAMARTIMADLQGRIPTIAGRLESILTDVNVTSRRLNEILTPENQQKILGMIDNLNAATQKFDTVLITMNSILKDIDDLVLDSEGDLAVTMKESRYIVESIARNIDAINQNMDGAARNLYEFSRQIRQNPGLLLGGTSPEDKGASQ
ncbi:MAG: MCE family protein [Rhodospirillales bacterium]|nr:MCE family protein [Rhodospirillales bacterium]MBO6785680.1 MCE family protein [Rhodospirillales bacterium]